MYLIYIYIYMHLLYCYMSAREGEMEEIILTLE